MKTKIDNVINILEHKVIEAEQNGGSVEITCELLKEIISVIRKGD